MSKTTFATFLTLLIIVLVGVSAWYIVDNYAKFTKGIDDEEEVIYNNENSDEDVNNVVEDVGITRTVNDFQFKDEYGSGQKLITIKAVECERLSGFAGAGSHVYCVTGNKELIHLELVGLTQQVVATNIDRIEVNGNGVLAYYTTAYNSKIEDNYVTYVSN